MRIHHIHPGAEARDTLSSPSLEVIYSQCLRLIRQNRLARPEQGPGEQRGR